MRKDQPSLVSPELDNVRRDNEALADYQQGTMTFEAFLTLVRPSIKQKVRQVYHARFSNILEPFLMEEVAQEMEMVLWKKAKHVKEVTNWQRCAKPLKSFMFATSQTSAS